MNCELARSRIPLFLYGELSFDEEEAFEQHLDACAWCRGELKRETMLHGALDRAGATPPADLLDRCRVDLTARIRGSAPGARALSSWRNRAWEWFVPVAGKPALVKPAGALALVALGFFAARWSTPTAPGEFHAGLGDPSAAHVRSIEPDGTGGVQLVVEETSQRVLTGRLDDERIRRLVMAAAKDPADPGLRVESIDALKDRRNATGVRQTLLSALQHDPNAGVRLEALEGLKADAGDPEIRRTLAQVLLHDDNSGVRTQAIDLLIQKPEMDTVGVLQQLLQKEDNSYVRMRSQTVLRNMNASVGTF